jgi:hypothetical protein
MEAAVRMNTIRVDCVQCFFTVYKFKAKSREFYAVCRRDRTGTYW